ncbi:arginine--tRNA ligase [Candidatus Woesebacteria bacterium]|nr:arginine--tRNA ligase [Candidatus Woesebacteria bacterium]
MNNLLFDSLSSLYPSAQFEISTPTLEHGDLTTNIALVLAKQENMAPRDLAQKIINDLNALPSVSTVFSRFEIAGPGFINAFYSPKYVAEEYRKILIDIDSYGLNQSRLGQKVIVEYTDPNPFKEFHIGHLYPNIVGETIARLNEAAGAKVFRAVYQGDVGMHVAKTMWGMKKLMETEHLTIDSLEAMSLNDRVAFMGRAYAFGATAYKDNEEAISEMKVLNKKVYEKDIEVYGLYQKGKSWSMEYFDKMYERLGTHFDLFYLESEVADDAVTLVRENLNKGIFTESQGAIVYEGEKDGLHTRVFINSQGIPTYEAKDLALASRKVKDVPYDESIIVTGNEVDSYFKVILKVLSKINPELAAKTKHISHGMITLPEGKISSRTGHIITAASLLDTAAAEAQKLGQTIDASLSEKVGLAAVKYALLKSNLGGDVEYSFATSVTFNGNSGPYLQYTYARTQSLREKSSVTQDADSVEFDTLRTEEQELMRFLARYPGIIVDVQKKYSPSMLCTYLYELASKFNFYYNVQQIVGSDQEAFRVHLAASVGQVLKNGLHILGIEALPKM